MLIKRTSISSGKVRTIDIPVTIMEMEKYAAGTPVEKAFPRLKPILREFIVSGMTRSEWLEVFGNDSEMGITSKEEVIN